MTSLPRITPDQAKAIEEQRELGRTDRQIERVLGLTYGLLSKPYLIGEDPRPILSDRKGHWIYPAPKSQDAA